MTGTGLGEGQRLVISFVGPRVIRRINQAFLAHDRVTDVIAFDYRHDHPPPGEDEVAVELLICPDLALVRGRELLTGYAAELTLYLVHGLLHAAGHDDHDAPSRRRMRAAERRGLAILGRQFPLDQLFRAP